jgi:hypothetical protein
MMTQSGHNLGQGYASNKTQILAAGHWEVSLGLELAATNVQIDLLRPEAKRLAFNRWGTADKALQPHP